ncbi:MAG: hypothetical protein WBF53_00705, partial [Litorimonas sp.]
LHPARKPNPVHRCTPLANSKEDTVPTGAPARSDQNGAGAPLTHDWLRGKPFRLGVDNAPVPSVPSI